MAHIDQSVQLVQITNVPETEEDRAEMEMNVDLAEVPSIDRLVEEVVEPMVWSTEQTEQHNSNHKSREQQNRE